MMLFYLWTYPIIFDDLRYFISLIIVSLSQNGQMSWCFDGPSIYNQWRCSVKSITPNQAVVVSHSLQDYSMLKDWRRRIYFIFGVIFLHILLTPVMDLTYALFPYLISAQECPAYIWYMEVFGRALYHLLLILILSTESRHMR